MEYVAHQSESNGQLRSEVNVVVEKHHVRNTELHLEMQKLDDKLQADNADLRTGMRTEFAKL